MASEPTVSDAGRMIAIAIVEDDPILGESLLERLGLEGYEARWWRTGTEALEGLQRDGTDAIICDIRLPDLDGEQLYRRLLPDLGQTPIIFITAYGDIEQAVRLTRAGADDYITKPFAMEVLLSRLSTAISRGPATSSDGSNEPLDLGQSPAMQRVEAILRRVRDVDSPVMLRGELGSGKEMAARFLHAISARHDQPFIFLDCRALQQELTSFDEMLREKANGGTAYLDEVGELPPAQQAQLFAFLAGRHTSHAASKPSHRPRIICSTSIDLAHTVGAGRFRADLFYQLNVVEVQVPALRHRLDDVLPLAAHYLSTFSARFGKPAQQLTRGAEEALLAHAWPGNVRELQNRLERAVAMVPEQISAADLFPERGLVAERADNRLATLAEIRAEAERRHISTALDETGGEIGRTAGLLGVSRTTLWDKMRRLGLEQRG